MATKIYDESVLEEHADFTFSLDISNQYSVLNADGTVPHATLKVKGGTIKDALSALVKISENEGEEVFSIMSEMILDEYVIGWKHEDFNITEYFESSEFFGHAENTDKWREIDLSVSLIMSQDSEPVFIEITLKAPSYLIAYNAFLSITDGKRLNSFVTSLMPDDDEYYDD